MFSAYIEKPRDYRFEGQDDDEEILLVLRAHPVTNLKWIVPAIFLIILPFFEPNILLKLGLSVSLIPASLILVYILLNYLLTLTIIFEGFLHWYFNVYIITEKSIIDVDFYSVLYKNIDVAPLRNIEDTSSSMKGILNSVFNYGNVSVQTAGASNTITLESVPRPHDVADFILDQANRNYGEEDNAGHHPV